jgi:hypothetical protein
MNISCLRLGSANRRCAILHKTMLRRMHGGPLAVCTCGRACPLHLADPSTSSNPTIPSTCPEPSRLTRRLLLSLARKFSSRNCHDSTGPPVVSLRAPSLSPPAGASLASPMPRISCPSSPLRVGSLLLGPGAPRSASFDKACEKKDSSSSSAATGALHANKTKVLPHGQGTL